MPLGQNKMQVARLMDGDISRGGNLARAMRQLAVMDDSYFQADFEGLTLRSAFQPIVSLGHQRTVGYEALLRVQQSDGIVISPVQLFAQQLEEARVIYLDRLCRALHIQSFKSLGDGNNWLFLNVNPMTMVDGLKYGKFFGDLLAESGFPPERIVIEVLEHALVDEARIANAVAFYRDQGCLLAIDDFGAGHSNFQRVWHLRPDIVKIDRSIIELAGKDAPTRRMLPGMVSILHETGCLVLIEGIETEDEAMIAMESNADMVQGWFFGKPASTLEAGRDTRKLVTGMHGRFMKQLKEKKDECHELFEHMVIMQQVRVALEQIASLNGRQETCVRPLLELPRADRCYLLDECGNQVGHAIMSLQMRNDRRKLFRPLDDATDSNWIRRPYLQRALQNPGEVQVTRPYLSVATGKLCVTLSVTLMLWNSLHVLCFDVFHEESLILN
jgi:EAL domain-containing protein (putative c-di-GMP-specific phosphodiesterase class I)